MPHEDSRTNQPEESIQMDKDIEKQSSFSSNGSEEKRFSLNSNDEKRFSLNSNNEKCFSLNESDDKHLSSSDSDDEHIPSNTIDEKRFSLNANDEKRFSSTTIDEQRFHAPDSNGNRPPATASEAFSILLDAVGGGGPWQWFLFLILSARGFFTAQQNMGAGENKKKNFAQKQNVRYMYK